MELERDVEGHLIRLCEQAGGLCIKHGQDGWPDRICVMPNGVTGWAETKRKKGREAALQTARIFQLTSRGHYASTVWSKEDAEKFVSVLLTIR